MSQTTITSFYNSRKRPATEDIISTKNKIPHIDRKVEISSKSSRISYLQNKCEFINDKQVSSVPNTATQEGLKNLERTPFQHGYVAQHATQERQCPKVALTKKLNASNVIKAAAPSKCETARKELSLGDIKKKLAGSSRLADLKATAERLSKGIQQLKQTSDKRNLKEFKTIDVEVPSSPSKKPQTPVKSQLPKSAPVPERPLISPRKVFVSPVKSPSKVPAYIRHAALATSSTSLPLPHHYRFLAELFRGMETVVALLYNRNEKITFNKLKPSVQEMLKRTFTEKHLAQIKFLVPDFYNFEVQKIKHFCATSQKDAFELVVTPNFPNDIKVMNPSVLLERRRFFYDTLLQLVKKHHSQYLSTLDPPMVIPDDKLARWHPEFELEKVSEVESGKLPEIPNTERCSSAQDVLAKARDLFKCNTKMERALEKLAQAKARGLTEQEQIVTGLTNSPPSTSSTTETQTSVPSTSGVTLLNPALRNLPASLLEKVKAKQAAKALETMTRSTQSNTKYLILSRLPDLARTLRNIFVTERKNVLALNIILSKLDSSFKANLSASDLQRDITALAEQVPEWVKLHDIRNNTYLKLDKNADLKSIVSKLETEAARFKSD